MMTPGPKSRWFGLALCLLLGGGTVDAQQVRAPLPLDVALSVRGHNGRSPINLSPDGEWLAHTVQTAETIPRDSLSWRYSATGFPFAEGDARMEATLTNTRTGEVVRPGGEASASWAGVWSPDGSRLAFYSDEGGEAGLWIWERASRTARRFPGVVVRPFFGFELVRWSADSRRLLLKVLPQGQTIASANAMDVSRASKASMFPPVSPGEPSVHVRRFDPAEARPEPDPTSESRSPPEGDLRPREVDLAIVDLRTREVTRLVRTTPITWYAFSPDERRVAYTVVKGWEANSQQGNFDLMVVDAAGGASRRLAENIRLGYGIEWNWSPTGEAIAYIASGQLADGAMVVVPLSGGAPARLRSEGVPSFDPGDGEYPPLWDPSGESLYGVGGGSLWRVNAASGEGTAVGSLADWRVRAIVSPYGQNTIWSTQDGTFWVVAQEAGGDAGILAVDGETGATRVALREAKSYSAVFNLAASEATGEIAFLSTDQQHLPDVWLFDTDGDTARQGTRLNPDMERYALGAGRIIEWKGVDGEPLKGALLLPPGYTEGERLPLVVWVYGGARGSTYINRFGFWGSLPTFNMHLLTTRGFAVLFPDAPLRPGRTMTDIVATVMPGVDAAIDQGYADPEKLAVMGQSYGSFNTLSLITQTTRFKAAVITAAVLHPDLFADYLQSIGYYEQGQGNMGGSIWEYPDRYADNSPLFLFDRIETPLLIGQGEKDGDLVPAEAIFAALQRLEKPVEYRLYQGEGHVITQRPNVRDFWQRRLEFLAERLDLTLDERGGVTTAVNP